MLKLELNTQQKLNISQKIIQSLEILSMNNMDLEKFLKTESEENVMLEFTSRLDDENFINSIKSASERINRNDISFENILNNDLTLSDYLLEQLSEIKIDIELKEIIRYLIFNLDNSGYLSIDLRTCAKDLGKKIVDVEKAHKVLMTFDPCGVGARDLKECLLIQSDDELLSRLIENHLEDIARNKLSKISKASGLTLDEVKELIKRLKELNPKPGDSYNSDVKTEYIIPDIFVQRNEDKLIVQMDLVNNIHLSNTYLNMLTKELDEETKKYLKLKMERTLMLMKSVEMRNKTLKDITEYVVEYQKDYFLYKLPLKVLKQKDVANEFGISISTVSRAINSKYLQYERGTIPLKYLFCKSVKESFVTPDYIKSLIKEIVERENKFKPLSDNNITNILNDRGIQIKRRTIHKYREELQIKSSQGRRKYEEKK